MQRWLSVAAGQITFGPCAARLVTLFGAPFDHGEVIARAHAILKLVEQSLSGQDWLADVALYCYVARAPRGRCRSIVAAPWHEGEGALQRRVGLDEPLAEIGTKVMRDHLTEQHRSFFPLLPFTVLGAVDGEGDVWATLRAGRPGFLASPDPRHLDLAIPPDPYDPAEAGLKEGSPAALLGIDLTTRRRNRLNGPVRHKTRGGFSLEVRQSFGNCPKYITLRSPVQPAEERLDPPERMTGLDGEARAPIEAADTFFVASYAPVGRVAPGRRLAPRRRGGFYPDR